MDHELLARRDRPGARGGRALHVRARRCRRTGRRSWRAGRSSPSGCVAAARGRAGLRGLRGRRRPARAAHARVLGARPRGRPRPSARGRGAHRARDDQPHAAHRRGRAGRGARRWPAIVMTPWPDGARADRGLEPRDRAAAGGSPGDRAAAHRSGPARRRRRRTGHNARRMTERTTEEEHHHLGAHRGPDPEDVPDLLRKLQERKKRHESAGIVRRIGRGDHRRAARAAGIVMSGPGVPGPGHPRDPDRAELPRAGVRPRGAHPREGDRVGGQRGPAGRERHAAPEGDHRRDRPARGRARSWPGRCSTTSRWCRFSRRRQSRPSARSPRKAPRSQSAGRTSPAELALPLALGLAQLDPADLAR